MLKAQVFRPWGLPPMPFLPLLFSSLFAIKLTPYINRLSCIGEFSTPQLYFVTTLAVFQKSIQAPIIFSTTQWQGVISEDLFW